MSKETECLFGVPMPDNASKFIKECRKIAVVEMTDFELLIALGIAVGYVDELKINISECLSYAGVDIGSYKEGNIFKIKISEKADVFLFNVPILGWGGRFVKRCRKATSKKLSDEVLLKALGYTLEHKPLDEIDIDDCIEIACVGRAFDKIAEGLHLPHENKL